MDLFELIFEIDDLLLKVGIVGRRFVVGPYKGDEPADAGDQPDPAQRGDGFGLWMVAFACNFPGRFPRNTTSQITKPINRAMTARANISRTISFTGVYGVQTCVNIFASLVPYEKIDSEMEM